MTMLCVRNNARGRAILVERLLLVDTGICVFSRDLISPVFVSAEMPVFVDRVLRFVY
jgi:hypothetical protein